MDVTKINRHTFFVSRCWAWRTLLRVKMVWCSYGVLTWIQRLNSQGIVFGKFNISMVSLVPWVHDGFAHVGMFQSQAVSKLVNRYPVQIDTVWCPCGEFFIIIKMSVTGKACQGLRRESGLMENFYDKIQYFYSAIDYLIWSYLRSSTVAFYYSSPVV